MAHERRADALELLATRGSRLPHRSGVVVRAVRHHRSHTALGRRPSFGCGRTVAVGRAWPARYRLEPRRTGLLRVPARCRPGLLRRPRSFAPLAFTRLARLV